MGNTCEKHWSWTTGKPSITPAKSSPGEKAYTYAGVTMWPPTGQHIGSLLAVWYGSGKLSLGSPSRKMKLNQQERNSFLKCGNGDCLISWMLFHSGNLSNISTTQWEHRAGEKRKKEKKSNKKYEEPKGTALWEKIKRSKYVKVGQIMTKRGYDNCLHVYEGCKPLGKERNCLIGLQEI